MPAIIRILLDSLLILAGFIRSKVDKQPKHIKTVVLHAEKKFEIKSEKKHDRKNI